MGDHAKLFEPVSIGSMTLRNRIVMAPMGTMLAAPDGKATPRLLDYYEARAAGGAGMVIVEATLVDLPGQVIPNQLRICDDSYIPGLRELAKAIRRHGARAALQLHHGGREAKSNLTGALPVAPSPIIGRSGEAPHELTAAEIDGLVRRFGEAAARAREAGFDAVEIHGAHGYIFVQFLTRAFNHRQDEYGGPLGNRARFLLRTLKAMREKAGPDYPVWSRINARHFGTPQGITLSESKRLARWLEKAGASAINVSCYGTKLYNFVNCPEVRGELAPLAGAIRGEVNVPVMAVGYMDVESAERALRQGMADLVVFGREFLADPRFPQKAAAGRTDEIRPCIACFRCLGDMIFKGAELRCSVNPAMGHERERTLSRAAKRKKVVVVGGGPGGMEAASVAALRGHDVTLLERSERLGGQLLLASRPPTKDRLDQLVRSLESAVRDSGARVKLGVDATAAGVAGMSPDAVIVATGVAPVVPAIPGLERANAVLARDVLSGKVIAGRRVVIIGGELVGCETADFLAGGGRKVTVVRRGGRMLTEKYPFLREAFLQKLEKKGVRFVNSAKYEQAGPEGLTITNGDGRRLLRADTIVIAAGAAADSSLATALEGRVPELYMVGDCKEPAQVFEAIHSGFSVASSL